MRVVSLENITNPVTVCTFDLENGGHFEIQGSLLYIIYEYDYDGFKVIDISNPSVPVIISSFVTEYNSSIACVEGDYAYIDHGIAGVDGGKINIVDISDPLNPQNAGEYSLLEIGRDALVIDDYFYFLGLGGIVALKIEVN